MKPDRLLCYLLVLLAFLDLTVHNVKQHSYHFELTDQYKHCINLFSHNLRPKKRKDCARSGSFQDLNCSTVVFVYNVSSSSSSSSSSFIGLFFTTNLTGDSRSLGEETSRNHQAYRQRPPRHHSIIRNEGCEEVRLN